jgi:hypothetical protein
MNKNTPSSGIFFYIQACRKNKMDMYAGEQEKELNSPERKSPLRKSAIVIAIGISLIVTVLDIIFYAVGDKRFSVNNAHIYLQSEQGGLSMTVDSQMDLKSYLHSYNIGDGECRLFYSESSGETLHALGNISGSVVQSPSRFNPNMNDLNIVFNLENSNYPGLRRLAWDALVSSHSKPQSRIDCTTSVSVNLFHVIPISIRWGYSTRRYLDEVSLCIRASNRIAVIKKLFSQIMQMSKQVSVDEFDSIVLSLMDFIPSVDLSCSPFPLQSLFVDIPRVSYAISTIKNNPDIQLLVETTPTQLQFSSNSEQSASTPLLVSFRCPSHSMEACSLQSAMQISETLSLLKDGKVYISADSSHPNAGGEKSNFVSELLGRFHSFSVEEVIDSEAQR